MQAVPNTVLEQQSCSDISFDGYVPQATTNDYLDFAQFAEIISLDSVTGRKEQRAWELAHLLFDRLSDVPSTVPESDREEYLLRFRKDKVSNFWKKLVYADVQAHVKKAKSPEERALAYLTGGMIEDACNALLEGKNFRLATLVAQIGGVTTFRHVMATQLESWLQLNVLSEFDDHVRAIYELLASNICVCTGKSGAGPENKVPTFNFASHFKLDWRRSFGLRLWYGIDASADFTDAVRQYAKDLDDGSEQVKPVPWFIEEEVATGWKDPDPLSREDLLWSLLKVHANIDSIDLAAAFAPESVSGNPMDARLSFQLVSLFRAQQVGPILEPSSAASDSLTVTFATDLATLIPTNPKALITTSWVLLHLSDVQFFF